MVVVGLIEASESVNGGLEGVIEVESHAEIGGGAVAVAL